MNKIYLLDCTLRDGGYINDWRFGESAIKDITDKMVRSGVDIVEIGFLKDEPYQKDRCVFNSMEQVKQVIGKKKDGVKYAVMCEVVNPLPLELLEPADKDSADIIRVIIWKTKHDEQGNIVDALQEGFEYCKGIVEKGYSLCVQPARVSQYSDEEFVAMVKKFSTLNPFAIYIVDSWGTQNPEDLLHYMHLADENMLENISLGYHGHNNMMQALSVAQAMIKEKFVRDIMIDASVYGIGRGAGNLNIEVIAKYMNRYLDTQYNVSLMLQIHENYIKHIYEKERWGYSILYYLTAIYNCNPAYVSMLKQYNLNTSEMDKCLGKICGKDKVIINRNAIQDILYKIRNDICVVIPTHGRSDILKECLVNVLDKYYIYGIDVIVFDSSTDNETEEMVNKLRGEKYTNLYFKKYNGRLDDRSIDDKVISAYAYFSEIYKYVWVVRDRMMIHIENIYTQLRECFDNNADFIVVYNFGSGCITKETYTNALDLFKEQFCNMMVLGNTIFRSETIKKIINTIKVDKSKNYSLWQPLAIFEYIAKNKFLAYAFAQNVFYFHPAAYRRGGGSFWLKFYMWQWYKQITTIMTNLPEYYGKYRIIMLKENNRCFNLHGPNFLLGARVAGGLNYRLVKKYSSYIKIADDNYLVAMYFIALLPIPIARYLLEIDSNSILYKVYKKIGYKFLRKNILK